MLLKIWNKRQILVFITYGWADFSSMDVLWFCIKPLFAKNTCIVEKMKIFLAALVVTLLAVSGNITSILS